MLPVERQGESGPLLVMLHWLGGGAQTWRDIGHSLALRGVRFVAVDAPGFGQAANQPASDVAHAVDAIIDTIRALRADTPDIPWVLGGHSMGGKFADIIARRAIDGEPGLQGLRGLLQISPSPPSPEPIQESRREEQLKTFGSSDPDPADMRKVAEKWLDGNTGKLPLPEAIKERAIQGILANSPRSYRAWFLTGSKEDWSSFVGTLALPALLLVGADEANLGEEPQRRLTLPHLPGARLVVLPGVKHLAPVERPGTVVEYFTEFLSELDLDLRTPDSRPSPATEQLLHSDHTSPITLQVMSERLGKHQTWSYKPETFTPAELRSARSLAEAVVPSAPFDLAGAVDQRLTAGENDGWRFATLPPDAEAWRKGLLSLDLAAQHAHSVDFLALFPGQQEALLQQVAEGKLGRGLLGSLHLGEGAGAYTATEFKQWFEEVRGELARTYMADPRTMDQIRYFGYADDLGFTQIQVGQHEEFER